MGAFQSGNRLLKQAAHLASGNLGKDLDSDVLIWLRIEIYLI